MDRPFWDQVAMPPCLLQCRKNHGDFVRYIRRHEERFATLMNQLCYGNMQESARNKSNMDIEDYMKNQDKQRKKY